MCTAQECARGIAIARFLERGGWTDDFGERAEGMRFHAGEAGSQVVVSVWFLQILVTVMERGRYNV